MTLIYPLTRQQKKVISLSSIGGLLEFYDFTIYGIFSAYFSQEFFPNQVPLVSLIASYSIFVIGYVVRPIGGILFSHIGDEIGRKAVLVFTMVLMGVASIGMGLLPTYNQIGILAPILMLLFRLIQGLAIGGELPSMIVYVAESMPEKRIYGMSGIFAGTVAGLLPGMLIQLLITHYLTSEQISSYGWRIPFLIGGLLCFIAYQVRKKLHETAAFNQLKLHNKLPIFKLLRHYWKNVLVGTGLVATMATSILLAIIYMPAYLTQIIGISPAIVSQATLITTIVSVIAIYCMPLIAVRYRFDQFSQRCIMLLVVAGFGCYYLIVNHYNLYFALIIFAFMQGMVVSLAPIVLSELFPVNIRLTGVALSYNMGFVIFGGLTPIIVTSLIHQTKEIYWVPSLWLFLAATLTLFSLRMLKKIGKKFHY